MPRLTAALAALLALSATQAAAETAPAPYSERYTGAFLALGAFGGPTLTTTARGRGGWSNSFGLWSQLSIPLQVIDLQLGWQRSQGRLTLPDGDPLALTQDATSLLVGLHPLFLAHLESDTVGYLLGGLHLLAGVDLERVQATFPEGERVDWDPGFLFGAGFDVPLDDVNDGGALWLGVQYRYNLIDLERRPAQSLDLRQHALYLRLAWRHNGLGVTVPGSFRPDRGVF